MDDTFSKQKQLFSHAVSSGFEGYDPYDGLNSRFFRTLGLHHSPFLRLAWIQFFKRSLINFRPPAGVPKGFNPKGGALFLSGALRMLRKTKDAVYRDACPTLLGALKRAAIRTTKGVAWGYNFDWQARAFFVPQGTPNIVTTAYVGSALLDYYELHNDVTIEPYIKGARDFILDEMIIWEKSDSLCFAYIPGKETEVHNANLLAASFVSRVENIWPRNGAREQIKKAAHFSLSDISEEGHWPYGTEPHHRWMDNFHTGFNIEALMTIRKQMPDPVYDKALRKTARVYIRDFFTENGIPKYYRGNLYPIDIHTIAESILVLTKVCSESEGLFDQEVKERAGNLCDKVLTYAFQQFWDKRGFFFYQKTKWGMNRISYIRWSQAWMYYALAVHLEHAQKKQPELERTVQF